MVEKEFVGYTYSELKEYYDKMIKEAPRSTPKQVEVWKKIASVIDVERDNIPEDFFHLPRFLDYLIPSQIDKYDTFEFAYDRVNKRFSCNVTKMFRDDMLNMQNSEDTEMLLFVDKEGKIHHEQITQVRRYDPNKPENNERNPFRCFVDITDVMIREVFNNEGIQIKHECYERVHKNGLNKISHNAVRMHPSSLDVNLMDHVILNRNPETLGNTHISVKRGNERVSTMVGCSFDSGFNRILPQNQAGEIIAISSPEAAFNHVKQITLSIEADYQQKLNSGQVTNLQEYHKLFEVPKYNERDRYYIAGCTQQIMENEFRGVYYKEVPIQLRKTILNMQKKYDEEQVFEEPKSR